jgi:hypothetical protein
MGGVVVDHDDHAAGLGRLFYMRIRSGFFQEFTQPRNFLHAKIMGVRPLEKDTLAADAEHKFIVAVRFDLTQMLDQFDGLAPA